MPLRIIVDASGPRTQRTLYEFRRSRIVIGRSRTSDIVLMSGGVARRHATIQSRAGRVIVRDLGSTNGTQVDGRSIDSPVVLHRDARVDIFDFALRLARDDESAPRIVQESGPEVEEALASMPAVERDLLQLIADDPDGDARQLYADWLLERGDPRGEFIALQCACVGAYRVNPRPTSDDALDDARDPRLGRIEELARQHAVAWLGGLVSEPPARLEVAADGSCQLDFRPGQEEDDDGGGDRGYGDRGRPGDRAARGGDRDGDAATLRLERGFATHPLCVATEQLLVAGVQLFRLSPTIYEVLDDLSWRRGTRIAAGWMYRSRDAPAPVAVKYPGHLPPLGMTPMTASSADVIYGRRDRVANDRATAAVANEIAVTATLAHPNIARYRGPAYWAVHGHQVLIMDELDGCDLAQLMYWARQLDGPIEQQLAAGIVSQLCLGLHAVHTCAPPGEYVHRQLSPGHVFVTRAGRIALLDFSRLALAPVVEPPLPDVAEVSIPDIWTLYASPEVSRGAAATPRSDLFSCGLILYELLCGVHPFTHPGTDVGEVLRAIARDEYPAPGRVLEMPSELARVARVALAERPEDRPTTALEMHHALESVIAAEGWSSRPEALANTLKPRLAPPPAPPRRGLGG